MLLAQLTVNHPPRIQLGDAPLSGFAGSNGDQIEILWQTVSTAGKQQDSFEVDYRRSDTGEPWHAGGSPSHSDTGVDTRAIHSASIVELSWDTGYEYRVRHLRDGVTIDTWQNTFHTRLPVGDAAPFSFAAYGDAAEIDSIANFDLVQNQINAGPAAFSLLLGDLTYPDGTHADYDLRFDPYLSPSAALWNAGHIDYPAIGNHEVITGGGQPTEENYSVPIPVAGITAGAAPPVTEQPEHNYSFDYGDVHFVTFDSNALNDAARLDGLLDWVVADLNASTATWKVVFGHHPLAGMPDKSDSPADNYYQQVVSRLGPDGAQADLFLAGHSHTYSWTYPLTGQSGAQATYVNDPDKDYSKNSGLVQVISGVGGKSLRAGDYEQFPFVAAGFTTTTATPLQYGYTLIDVTSNQLNVKYVAANSGEVIDQFTITDGPDLTQPSANLAVPNDNGESDLDRAVDAVKVSTTQAAFEVQLSDIGDGVDDVTVIGQTVLLSHNGVTLSEATDYTFEYDEETNRITLTASGGDFADGPYSITLNGGALKIADLAGNSMSVTTMTIEIDTSIPTVSFQQGVGGYAATVDTTLQEYNPTADNSAVESLNIDSGTGKDVQALLRFDNVFGVSTGQIPPGSAILSAHLELQVDNAGDSITLHRMVQSWTDTDTWDSLADGVQADGVEAAHPADLRTGSVATGKLSLDVTDSLQAWSVKPTENFGWALLPTGSNGVDFDSAESTNPPKLIVQYANDPSLTIVAISATDPNASEAGPDSGTFTVTRSGDTAGDLIVAYTLGGTATDAVDFDSIAGSVTIPDGHSSATFIVTPIDDSDAEGSETVIATLSAPTLSSGEAYYISTASDTVTILDDDLVTVDDVAIGETTPHGSVTSGDLINTYLSDDTYEAISEELYAKNKRSWLHHEWTFDVSGGSQVTLYVEAHHNSSVEDFAFEHSVDGQPWTPMLIVNKNYDDNVPQSFELPVGTSGPLRVRVVDTDRSNGEKTPDTLFVDSIYFRSDGGAGKPSVMLWASDASASEDGDGGSFTVSRTSTGGDLDVFYSIGGSAASGPDYNALSGTVTIPDGMSAATIMVVPVDDAEEEGSETVTLTLLASEAYVAGSPVSDTVTIADNDQTTRDHVAIGEAEIDGVVIASDLTDTYASDNTYEVIREELYAGKKRSRLQHEWTFDVTAGSETTFFLEAHHDSSSEDFAFEYSLDGSSWTRMLTVTKTFDDNATQSFVMPEGTSGGLHVRVEDTDHSRGDNVPNSIFIDHMYIRSVPAANTVAVANDDAYTVENGRIQTSAINGVLANDVDIDGDTLTARVVSQPSNGELIFSSDGSFTYTPYQERSDSFGYVVDDGHAESNVATVHIDNPPAPPPPTHESCLNQPGPLVTLNGPQSALLDLNVEPSTKFDATNATWYATSNTRIELSGDNLCWHGGFVEHNWPADQDWETTHHDHAFKITASNLVFENVWIKTAGDGISMYEGTDNFLVRGVYMEDIRDDAIEHDWLGGGTIEDTLINGAYVAFAARSRDGLNVDGSNNTWVIQDTLAWLRPQIGVYKGASPGHGGFFKWEETDNAPMLSLHNNIFMVGQDSNHQHLGVPPGKLIDASNNIVVWLGEGDYPDPLPDGFTITTDRSVWDNAVADWLSRHESVAAASVIQSSMNISEVQSKDIEVTAEIAVSDMGGELISTIDSIYAQAEGITTESNDPFPMIVSPSPQQRPVNASSNATRSFDTDGSQLLDGSEIPLEMDMIDLLADDRRNLRPEGPR